jgi:hypothetical protein
MRVAVLSLVAGALSSMVLVGCGGDAPAPDAAGGAAPSAPLKGKGLSQTSQLVGTWLPTTDADMPGIEFLKDGKAIAGDGSTGITVDYTVLEGGRLSVVMPGGITIVYEATIAGDQLELKGQESLFTAGGTQRFRRLQAGETIGEARKKLRQAEAKAYQDRVAALEVFLKQPGLVLAVSEAAPGAPPAIALELAQAVAGSFSGKAWHDDRPPHLDEISGQLVLDQQSQAARVTVQFGRRLQPPAPTAAGGGQVTLGVTGDAKSLRVAGKVNYGQGGATYDLALRSDPKLHAEVVKRFEAELARIESLKTPLVSLLKDFAILRGQLQPMAANQTPPDSAELVLARDPKSGQYRCEALFVGARGRGEVVASGAAEVVIVNDRPILRVVCPPAREMLLGVPDPNAKKLAGQWQPIGQSQGKGAQLDVVEALDAAARDARFEAQRQTLKGLGADAVFLGLAFEDSGLGLEMPISLRLQLTVKPDGSVAGKAEYPSMATVMTVAGQIAETPGGPRLQLGYTAAETTPGDQIFLRSIQRGAWSLAPAASEGAARLDGYFAGPPVRTTALTRVSEESKARARQKLVDVLKGDGRFYLSRVTGWQVAGQIPTVVEWKLDEATGKVTGRTITGGRPLGGNERIVSIYDGTLKSEGDWTVLSLVQTTPFKANDKFVTELELRAHEDADGGLYVGGNPTSIGRVVNDKRASEAKPAPGYPVGFIPLTATDAAIRAEIDKVIAAAEKEKSDADAKRQADATVADEARRAKFKPFAAPFQTKGGAVITADLTPEMSTVVLDAQVDEAKATLAGRGIDLREMPFRELTYQGSLDARGQLTITTSVAKDPLLFNAATDKGLTYGRTLALTPLADEQRAKLDALIALGKRLGAAAPAILSVEALNAATAKTREASLPASDLPGICLFQKRRNDQVAAMFTVKANGRYRWTKEPISLRLSEPLRGKGIYVKGGLGPTDNLTVVVNGVHTASIAAIERSGGAVVTLPADLEILDLVLKAEGTAQARGVVLLK